MVEEKIRTFVRQRPRSPTSPSPKAPPAAATDFPRRRIDVDDDCLDVTETSICYTANDQQRCYDVDGLRADASELYEATGEHRRRRRFGVQRHDFSVRPDRFRQDARCAAASPWRGWYTPRRCCSF